jgi:hypothetical protein
MGGMLSCRPVFPLFFALFFLGKPVFGQTPQHPPPTGDVDRWLDLQTAEIETRYRTIQNSVDVLTNNQWQHKQSLRAALKFDPAGRYRLSVFAGTGGGLTGSWDSTGVGTGDAEWSPRAIALLLGRACRLAGAAGRRNRADPR